MDDNHRVGSLLDFMPISPIRTTQRFRLTLISAGLLHRLHMNRLVVCLAPGRWWSTRLPEAARFRSKLCEVGLTLS